MYFYLSENAFQRDKRKKNGQDIGDYGITSNFGGILVEQDIEQSINSQLYLNKSQN